MTSSPTQSGFLDLEDSQVEKENTFFSEYELHT